MTLEIPGHVPSKKNLWGPRKGGGIVLNATARQEIQTLITYARIFWGPRKPISHPVLVIEFHVLHARADRDNKLSTILDVLQKAGVIVNDNIAHCNAQITLAPAVIGGASKTVIQIS